MSETEAELGTVRKKNKNVQDFVESVAETLSSQCQRGLGLIPGWEQALPRGAGGKESACDAEDAG